MSELLGSNRPNMKGSDKAVAYGIAAVVIGGLGYGLYRILPYLITLAENTIIFGVELAAAAVLLMVLSDRGLWLSVYYGWQNIARKIRRSIVREDPIGILDTVIARFHARLEELQANMAKADAARKRQANAIKECFKKRDSALALATTAQKLGETDLKVSMHAANANRWDTAGQEMEPMQAALVTIQENMEHARELVQTRLGDLENQKDVLAIKLETMKSSQTAVKSFKRFFGSNPDLAMLHMSVDEIERQSTEAEAEIEQFLKGVQPIVEEADLKKQANALQAMEKFGKYLGTPTTGTQLLEPAKEAVSVKER